MNRVILLLGCQCACLALDTALVLQGAGGDDTIGFDCVAPAGEAEALFEVFAQMKTSPALAPEELDKLRPSICDAIARIEEDWRSSAGRYEIRVHGDEHKPSSLVAAGGGRTRDFGIQAVLDSPLRNDPPQRAQVLRGAAAHGGQLVGECPIPTDGAAGDARSLLGDAWVDREARAHDAALRR